MTYQEVNLLHLFNYFTYALLHYVGTNQVKNDFKIINIERIKNILKKDYQTLEGVPTYLIYES